MAHIRPLAPESILEIEALTRKIFVAQELDGEIRAELRGHIEDKVRGYVSGEVKVSEADAIVLAKAHFGDAAVIKGMFQEVHAKAHAGSMMRRVAIAAVVYLFVWNMVFNFVTSVWDHAEFSQANAGQSFSEGLTTIYPSSWLVEFVYFLVVKAVVLLVIWEILRGWKRGAAVLMRVRPQALGIMAISYVVLLILEHIPVVARFLDPITTSPFVRPEWDMAARYLVVVVWLCVSAWIWIGWCEQGVRTRRAVVWGAVSWLIFELLVLPLDEALSTFLVRFPHMGFWEMLNFYHEGVLLLPSVMLLQAGAAIGVGTMYIVCRRKRQVVVV